MSCFPLIFPQNMQYVIFILIFNADEVWNFFLINLASIINPEFCSLWFRFALKKQASLKDNLPASFAPVNQSFSRQSSSSMSSSSDEILPDEKSPELEAVSPLWNTLLEIFWISKGVCRICACYVLCTQ